MSIDWQVEQLIFREKILVVKPINWQQDIEVQNEREMSIQVSREGESIEEIGRLYRRYVDRQEDPSDG